MPSALELVSRAYAERGGRVESRFNIDPYLAEYFPTFNFGGHTYQAGANGLVQTLAGNRASEVVTSLPGYSAALRACPAAFSAQMVRASVLSGARFTFRNRPTSRTPRRLFGTRALELLEEPWPKATTGDLIARMEWHEGLAGNAYVVRQPGRLRVIRPDWTAILYGSQQEPEEAAHALDGVLLGYVYANGGLYAQRNQVRTLLPDEVAHWAPIPDPENAGVGQSWLTPAIREIQADRLATEHKVRFFENGATPNLVIKGIPAVTREQFVEIVDELEARHSGAANAYRTLYLTAGADATVVGSNLAEIDLKAVNGSSETRISMLSRVHPTILGIAEGLSGSSLNAGNFGQARRIWADSWIYPTLQNLAGSLADLVKVPGDAELWTDTVDMPILSEDAKDAADIEQVKASTIVSLINGGFTPESAIAAVRGQDMSLLQHTGLISVQLQPPGMQEPSDGGAGPKASPEDDDDVLDEDSAALLEALNSLGPKEAARAWDPAKHPRNPKGSPGGGKFKSLASRLVEVLKHHLDGDGDGDPFDGFSREQLRKVAKARGIDLPRGASREHIAKALLGDLKGVSAPKVSPKHASKGRASKRIAGKDRVAEIVRDIRDNIGDASMRNSDNYDSPFDLHLRHIAHRQGFDAKPQVGTRDEVDGAVGAGWVEVWRGAEGDLVPEINDRLRHGDFEPAHGMYGNGVYTSTRRVTAERYRGRWATGRPPEGSDYRLEDLSRTDVAPDSMLRIAVDPQARIADLADVTAEHAEWLKTAGAGSLESEVLSDLGRFAAARGYDVLLVSGVDDGGQYPPGSGDAPFADQYIVLNRSVMLVQRAEDEP